MIPATWRKRFDNKPMIAVLSAGTDPRRSSGRRSTYCDQAFLYLHPSRPFWVRKEAFPVKCIKRFYLLRQYQNELVRFAGGTATDKSDTSFDARIWWANAIALHFEPIAIAKSRELSGSDDAEPQRDVSKKTNISSQGKLLFPLPVHSTTFRKSGKRLSCAALHRWRGNAARPSPPLFLHHFFVRPPPAAILSSRPLVSIAGAHSGGQGWRVSATVRLVLDGREHDGMLMRHGARQSAMAIPQSR